MATIILIHHAAGLTTGVQDLAQQFKNKHHNVHVPDLYQGKTFTSIEEGLAHAQDIGNQELINRARQQISHHTGPLIFGGISLGVLIAQHLAQTDQRNQGLLALESFIDPRYLPGQPNYQLPTAIHAGAADTWFQEDAPAAQEYTRQNPHSSLHLYPNCEHLFTDSSWPTHSPQHTQEVISQTHTWLTQLDADKKFAKPTTTLYS